MVKVTLGVNNKQFGDILSVKSHMNNEQIVQPTHGIDSDCCKFELKIPADKRVAKVGLRHLKPTRMRPIGLQLIDEKDNLITGFDEMHNVRDGGELFEVTREWVFQDVLEAEELVDIICCPKALNFSIRVCHKLELRAH